MQIFVDMAKTLAVFCLLEQVILNLLPSGIYERYVKFYLGLLLLILLLQPVLQIFHLTGQLDSRVFTSAYEWEEQAETVRGLAGKIKEKYWPPGKDQLLILVLVGLLLAVIAIPVEKKGTADEISREREMNSGMMGNSSGSGNSSVDDNLESGMSAGEDEPLSDLEKYEAQTEQKLEELLSTVDGAGQVRVMLTWEGSSERQVEKDRISNADSVEEETIYQENDSGKYPYVVSWTNPKVTGVLVIAEGGGNTKVKAEILEAVQALFGIEPHKIKIMKMGEGGNIVEKN